MRVTCKIRRILGFLVIVLLFAGVYFVMGGYGQSGPDAAPNLEEYGLVGYWNFEEGSGQTVYDRSGNGNDGTLGSSTAVEKSDPVFVSGHDSNGPGGTGLQFDGVDDYVSVSSSSSLNSIASSFTLEMWINVDSFVSWKRHLRTPGIKWEQDNGQNFGITLYNGANEIGEGWISADPPGRWQYIAVTWDGVTVTWYKNGQQITTFTTSQNAINTGDLTIGAGDGTNFDGVIDEVRIYNRALSADEIRMHYNQKKPVLHLKMDEGSGTIVHDESFNNNDGTLNLGTSGNTTVSNAWVNGKHGSAISFDGVDNYIDVGNDESLDLHGNVDFTISGWIKSVGYPANNSALAGKWYYTPAEYGYLVYFGYSGPPGTISIQSDSTHCTTDVLPINDNKWHYIAAVKNGNIGVVYLDGVQKVCNGTLSTTVSSTSGSFQVGTYANNEGGNFNGLIDDVRIYNYARTADEILADYNAGKAAHMGKNNQQDDGLVGYWNFEEGSGQTVYDRSGNGNDGTLGSSTAVEKSDPVFVSGHDSNGPGGTGLQFDGVDDYVDAGNDDSLNITGDITILAWIKRRSFGTPQTIVDKQKTGNDYTEPYRLIFEGWDNTLRFQLGGGGTSWNSFVFGAITDNNWHHIAVTIEGVSVKGYIDGVQSGTTQTFSGTRQSSNLPFLIGKQKDGFYFNGVIDEVRIYNRALSADEIRMHYNQKKPVLHLKMDEGSGTIVHDESFNNNDANFPAADANKPSWSSP